MISKAFTKAMGLGITAVSFRFERAPLCVRGCDTRLKKSRIPIEAALRAASNEASRP